ncbi:MAG: hypothetical protein GY702_17160, partial [Desulfobulbaceae bacterium]|nr:hypothetical protein [Desulfobulbaceae bacterium]
TRMEVTDNVVEFMIGQVKKLPPRTQRVLPQAACIGNDFDLQTLALIDDLTLKVTGEALLPAISEGIIMPLSDQYRLVHLQEQDREELDFGVSYKFQHDRVQQAAYSLLDEKEKKKIHIKIARLLLGSTPEEKPEKRFIEIVRHFNEGRELIVDEQELESLAHLNLQASKKATRSNAFRPAFEYARAAKALLPKNAWGSSYTHCFEVYKEYAETAYLSRKLEIAEEITQLLLEKAKTRLERAEIYQMLVRQYVFSGENKEAVLAGIQGLSLLGIKLSIKPGTLSILKEVGLIKWNLGKRSVESLIDMPLMEDAEKQIAMKIMIELSTPAYMLGFQNLWIMIALKGLNISLRFGNSPEAAYSYIGYAVLLTGVLGNLKTSYEFGKLAVKLNKKLDDMEFRCTILFLYGSMIHHWNHHWKTTLQFVKEAMETGLQSGDLIFVGYASCLIPKRNFDLNLMEASKLGEENLQIIASKYQNAIDNGKIFQGYRLNLMGLTKDRFSLSDSNFNEDECLAAMRQRNYLPGIAYLWLAKLEFYYLYESYQKGLKLIPEIDKVKKAVMALPSIMEYSFYSFLTYATVYTKMSKTVQRQALKRMKKEYKQMRKWHDHYPVNSYHFVYMMESEFAQIKGDNQAA